MMNEDFVTYEQAKALKELGFNWECHYRFNIDKQIVPNVVYSDCGVDSDDVAVDVNFRCIGDISAPTLAQAQKWLREIYHISVDVCFCRDMTQWCYYMVYMYEYTIKDPYTTEIDYTTFYDTYEEALSAGVDRAIELLKQQNNGK